jgi:hypothetical protein
VPLKSLEYWVLAQLILDLGLFLLVIFFLCKIRALGRLLQSSQPAGGSYAEEIDEISKRLRGLEQRLESRGDKPPDGIPDLFQSVTPGHALGREPPLFFPEIDRGKSLRAQVAELAGRGLSPEEIACHLKLQAAEVKVALDLSRLLAKRESGSI